LGIKNKRYIMEIILLPLIIILGIAINIELTDSYNKQCYKEYMDGIDENSDSEHLNKWLKENEIHSDAWE